MRSLSLFLALLGTALPALTAGSAEEARAWIERMNKAVINRNYDGVLVHRWAGGGSDGSEVLHLIHRMQDGNLKERVVLLGGYYEITRDGSKYLEYDHRKGIVKAQTLTRSYGYLPAFNGISADSDKLYDIRVGGAQRLEGYPGTTQLITVIPHDELRYAYRFWLDQQSAMPIKTQVLIASSMKWIDEISFSVLSMQETIPDELLKPALTGKKFDWVKPKPVLPATVVKRAFTPRSNLLPAGFQVRTFSTPEAKAAASVPETRFLISDGISWVSAIVSVADAPQKEGLRQLSASAFAYVLQLDGHYISVGGEVPPATVKAIAEAIRPE